MRHRGHRSHRGHRGDRGHRRHTVPARPVERPPATGRHRSQPVPAYPWLRVAGTVGLATLVPFTGGWVAVAAISLDLGGPSPSHDAAGSVVPAGAPSRTLQTASPSVVLSRSSTPSLEAVTRVRHRAERLTEASPAPDVGGRHRRDTAEGSSTTPHSDDQQRTGDYPQHTGDGRGSGSAAGGSPGSDADGGHGGGGHGGGGRAHGHDRGEPNGNGYGHGDDSTGHRGNAGGRRENSGAGTADSSSGRAGENGNAQGNGRHGTGPGSEHGNGHG